MGARRRLRPSSRGVACRRAPVVTRVCADVWHRRGGRRVPVCAWTSCANCGYGRHGGWCHKWRPHQGAHTHAVVVRALLCGVVPFVAPTEVSSVAIPFAYPSTLVTDYSCVCIRQNGAAMERLTAARCIVFDKTGTLTTGATLSCLVGTVSSRHRHHRTHTIHVHRPSRAR